MMAQRAPPGTMDLGGGGSGGSRRKKQPPRLPVGKTPVTPGTPLVTTPLTTPTPTPTPTSQSYKAIPDIPATIKLEELTIQEEKYTFKAEDLVDQGHLGDGAFGTVTKMLYPPTKTTMAVKKIPMRDLHATEKSGIVELAMIMKHGACPFIVEFYGCLIRDGDVWICMELLDASMDKISKRVDVLGQSIPEEIIGKMTVAVIKALHYLKEELLIIHRDVKPSNILVSRKCEFKLCDFGISGRLVDSLAKTMEVGCRPYMAPERIDPKKAEHGYTIQSDVWSFGITLLELALGKFPYSKWATIFEQLNAVVNGPPPKLPSDGKYSPELLEFSAACLRKDHLQRPDYKRLQELSFFTRYSTAKVDTLTWYNSIRES